MIVRFPEGETQYWLTDKSFAVGEPVTEGGETFLVSEILDPESTDTHLTVTLRKPTVAHP